MINPTRIKPVIKVTGKKKKKHVSYNAFEAREDVQIRTLNEREEKFG